MVTIKDIAKECNISVATVSKIMNGKQGASDETREKVLKLAKEWEYTPNSLARNLKSQCTKSIGVIAEDVTIFSIPEIIDGITKYFEERGYHIILANLRLFKKYDKMYYNRDEICFNSARKEIKSLMSKQVEGIIYISSHERVLKSIPENLKVPAVMAYGFTESPSIPSIVVDDKDGAYQLTNYLIKKGHRKIGVISGREDNIHARERIKGYSKALFDAKILYDPELVCPGDWERDGGYRFTDELLERGATAIFCMNDLMAVGVYDRVGELGLAPGKDISIVGYDNRSISKYAIPAITTVELPLNDIGYKAGEVLYRMVSEGSGYVNKEIYRIPCKLIERESVVEIKAE